MKTWFIMLAAVCLFNPAMQAQRNKSNDQAQTKKQEQTVAPQATVEGPEISFTETVHDYGTIARGANGDCEFKFKNIGTEPLILSNVQSSCGCTVPTWPREPVMPGQEASIKVHYDTTRIGSISKTVMVASNAKTDRITLRIAGTVLAPAQ